ncbi:MAG: hypothetical protein KGQ38_07590, partial [Actinomycetales bacterium]|nr:hypothetical protein [Actinomycetales bacterium]
MAASHGCRNHSAGRRKLHHLRMLMQVAAGLAPLAVGTETDGSIVCPSSLNGVVGIKPTVGLVSKSGVIPVAGSMDSPGPMG